MKEKEITAKKYILKIFGRLGISVFAVIAAFAVFLGIATVWGDWNEPSQPPTGGNVAAPMTVGAFGISSPYQRKFGRGVFTGNINPTGSIGAANFEIRSIGRWMSELAANFSPACNWQGWKCDCNADTSGLHGRLIVGMHCNNNQLADFKVIQVYSASGGGACPATPPSPCDGNLYSIAYLVAAPTNFFMSLSGTWATYTWDDNANNEDGYWFQVQNLPGSGGAWQTTNQMSQNTYATAGNLIDILYLTTGNYTYRFRVAAYLDTGPVAYSNSCTLVYNFISPASNPTIVSVNC